jgi:hypothetical protein
MIFEFNGTKLIISTKFMCGWDPFFNLFETHTFLPSCLITIFSHHLLLYLAFSFLFFWTCVDPWEIVSVFFDLKLCNLQIRFFFLMMLGLYVSLKQRIRDCEQMYITYVKRWMKVHNYVIQNQMLQLSYIFWCICFIEHVPNISLDTWGPCFEAKKMPTYVLMAKSHLG